MKLYGLAFVKNGVNFDYPFIESLKSLAPIVSKTYINVGIGDDGTKEKVSECDNLEIIDVDWDDNRSDKGLILSEMTNIPLKKMREDIKDDDAWVFYLQSDEVIHEKDYSRILEDIKKAHENGCDVVSFRYLHFFHDHNTVALHKRWYPQEIRAFKLNSKILSHGDAQTFSGWTSSYDSDAFIYHYGHVRQKDAYKKKMDRFHRYYQQGFDHFRKHIKRSIKDFLRDEKLHSFYGDHPIVMKDRIARLGGVFIAPEVVKVSIFGDLKNISSKFLGSINAKEVLINTSGGIEVNFDRSLKKSFSPISRAWNDEFRLAMALYKKNIGLKKI